MFPEGLISSFFVVFKPLTIYFSSSFRRMFGSGAQEILKLHSTVHQRQEWVDASIFTVCWTVPLNNVKYLHTLDCTLTCSLTFVAPDGPMLPKLLCGVHAYTPAASSLTVAMNREPSGVKVHPGYWEKKKHNVHTTKRAGKKRECQL